MELCEHNQYHCYRCEVKLLKFTIEELEQQNNQLIEVIDRASDLLSHNSNAYHYMQDSLKELQRKY